MNELVSIIVPVYNVENYIKKCAISLIEQTYENCEFLFINDGTPDNSIKILQEIKDDRIRIINQMNSGVSSARNNGIKHAKGKYIVFVDADDYLSGDYVEYMLSLIKYNDSDFAYSIDNFKSKKEMQNKDLFTKNITSNDSVGLLLSPSVTVGCWNKIYKKSLLDINNLLFSEDLFYGEGLNFIIRVSLASTNISIGNKKVYYYRKNNISSATSSYNIKKYRNGIESLNRINDLIDLNDDYVKSMYILHTSMFYLGAITKMIEYKKRREYKIEYLKWKNNIKNNLPFLLKSKHVTIYRKVLLFVGYIFPNVIAFLDYIRCKKIIKNSID